MKNTYSALVFVVHVSPLLLSVALQAQSYTVVDLGSHSWSYSAAHGINGSGSVTGEFEPMGSPNMLGFLYHQGTINDLGHLSGSPYAVGSAVNDSKQVVGESGTANSTHAF